jgi:hypothetical protein
VSASALADQFSLHVRAHKPVQERACGGHMQLQGFKAESHQVHRAAEGSAPEALDEGEVAARLPALHKWRPCPKVRLETGLGGVVRGA